MNKARKGLSQSEFSRKHTLSGDHYTGSLLESALRIYSFERKRRKHDWEREKLNCSVGLTKTLVNSTWSCEMRMALTLSCHEEAGLSKPCITSYGM